MENYRWPDLVDYYSDWLRYRQWYLRTPGMKPRYAGAANWCCRR